MTLPPLPADIDAVDTRAWATYAPYLDELQERPLTADNYHAWLEDWSHLARLFFEAMALTHIARSQDTRNAEAEAAFLHFITHLMPKMQLAEHRLNQRLLALNPPDAGLQTVLRQVRNQVEMFREENIPLRTQLHRLASEYDKITGALLADWDGEAKNLDQLSVFLRDPAREVRERAWRASMGLWHSQREALNTLYLTMLPLRTQVAHNAGLPDYRAYAFRERGRFDYTPEDCLAFHEAIEAVFTPAARRVLERKQARLGVDSLRPWDEEVEAGAAQPLRPYQGQAELIARCQAIFDRVGPAFGRYLGTMAQENLLDLDTRAGKALGGYCTGLPLRQRPFIFMNGVGIHRNVQTMLHEAGHAFHTFEAMRHQPYIWQQRGPMEFNEVASMAMELLAASYLTQAQGGFYTPAEAARAQIEHLEKIILFLPYMAVVDAFQHWVYTHPHATASSEALDTAWDQLWLRFMPNTDWSGLEEIRRSGWHRKQHIFRSPFYYVEYGMAQIGALQIWRNSQQDHAGAVAAYRRALQLGGSVTLPELYQAAGATFRFDSPLLAELAERMEARIAELEQLA